MNIALSYTLAFPNMQEIHGINNVEEVDQEGWIAQGIADPTKDRQKENQRMMID